VVISPRGRAAPASLASDHNDAALVAHALAAPEALYRSLVEQLPAAIYTERRLFGADEKPTYVSPYIETLVGHPPEAFLANGELWSQCIHSEDRARVRAAADRVNETGEPFAEEYRMVGRDGRVVWVSDAAVRVHDAHGTVLGWQGVALDVTARRQAEDALRQSEARFRSLLENAPDAVAVLDADGVVRFAAPAVERVLGYPLEDFVGADRFDLVHPEDEPGARRAFAEVTAAPGARVTVELRARHADGSWRWLETTAQNRLDDPAVGGVVVNFRDVTARVEAEVALARERDLLRTLMDHLPDAVYVKDASSRFLRLNPATAQTLGITDVEEAIGKTDFDFFPEALARRYFADEQQVIATGEPLLNRLEPQREDEATGEWWLTSTVPLRDAGGEVVGIVGSGRDITERLRTEEALRESEARHRALLAALPDIVFRLDRDGTYLDYKADRLADLVAPPEVFLGRTVAEMLPPEVATPIAAAIERVLDSGGAETVEYALELDRGRTDFEARLVAAGADEVVAVVRDVTERKRLDAELRTALDAAHAANLATRRFLAMMSHELRTPMQTVMGYAELLLAGPAGSLTPAQIEDIQTIHRGASRLVSLVKQMLDFSLLEAGQMEMKMEPVDLETIVEQVRRDVTPLLTTKNLPLRIDLPPDLPPVLGDAMGVHLILLNLVGNAVKFTDDGEVALAARGVTDGVEVTVSDTGIGIAADALPHIFEEFRQADSGVARRYGGVGLGLAIAKMLVEQLQATIGVTSQPGAGSIFTVRFRTARRAALADHREVTSSPA
jgi:PAS domain S-box-containing protein